MFVGLINWHWGNGRLKREIWAVISLFFVVVANMLNIYVKYIDKYKIFEKNSINQRICVCSKLFRRNVLIWKEGKRVYRTILVYVVEWYCSFARKKNWFVRIIALSCLLDRRNQKGYHKKWGKKKKSVAIYCLCTFLKYMLWNIQ